MSKKNIKKEIASMLAPRMTRCVYIIEEEGTGLYKIGVSRNPPHRRRDLQRGNPRDLRIVHAINSDEPRATEQAIHAALDEYRVSGEWFELPMGVVTYVKTIEELKPENAAGRLSRAEIDAI